MEAFGSPADPHLRKTLTDFSVSLETTTDAVKIRADVDLERPPPILSFAQFSNLQSTSGFSKTLAHCVGFSDHGGEKAVGVVARSSTPSSMEALIQSHEHSNSSRKEEFHGSLFSLHSPIARSTPSLDQDPLKFNEENSSCFGDNWNSETQNVSLSERNQDRSELFSSPESSKENAIKEEDQFSVGDFVWSKIKNNLWWPGRIYSSSDASNYALKYKQEDHHLVAYFGDASFSWCSPSQLEHFEDHFYPMSKQSNSKGFVSAVQMALMEVGRRLEMELTCSCLPFAMNSIPHPTLNAGIKQGICVDARRTGKFSVSHEPSELLNTLRFMAHNSFLDNMFDLTVLRSWLTALYKAKRGHRLPVYSDPQPPLNPVITDRNTLLEVFEFTELSNVDGVREKAFTPVSRMNNEAHQFPSPRNIHKIFEEQLPQRKQKSMVEILGDQGEDVDTKPDHSQDSISAEDGEGDSEPEFTSRSRKRNTAWRPVKMSVQSKSGRRRKVRPSVTHRYEVFDIESGSSGSEDESTSGLVNVKKTSSTDGNLDCESNEGPRGSTMWKSTHEIRKLTEVKGKRKDPNSKENIEEDTTLGEQEHEDSMVLESSRKVILTRERKKSKYLSPPYTTEMHEEHAVTRSLMERKPIICRDRASTPAGKLLGSPPVLMLGTNDLCPLQAHEGHCSRDDITSSQTQSRAVGGEFDLNEIRLSSDEALAELQFVAADFRHSGHVGTLDAVKKFFGKFRTWVYSTYEDGKPVEIGSEPPQPVGTVSQCDDAQFQGSVTTQQSPREEQKSVEVKLFSQPSCHLPTTEVHRHPHTEVESATRDAVFMRCRPEVEAEPATGDSINQSRDSVEQKPKDTKPVEIFSQVGVAITPDPGAKSACNHVGDNTVKKRKRGRPRLVDRQQQEKQQQQEQPQQREVGGVDSSSNRGRRSKETSSSASLYVSFPPAMSLPSKADLLKMYEEFGPVVEMETDVSHNSFCGRVAFVRTEDAERAFNSCVEENPFGEAEVSFKLRYPPGLVPATNENQVMGGKGNEDEEKRSSSSSDLGLIRQKLVKMTGMLEGSEVVLSREMKWRLEGELEGILQMLRLVRSSSSSS